MANRQFFPTRSAESRYSTRPEGKPRPSSPPFLRRVPPPPPPGKLSKPTPGGPPRWPQKLTTIAKRGTEDAAYVIDRITLPFDNPWKARMRPGGFDFFKDGTRAALCTWDGDVWLLEGLGQSLGKITWQRIATGLFQPLGLKIV